MCPSIHETFTATKVAVSANKCAMMTVARCGFLRRKHAVGVHGHYVDAMSRPCVNQTSEVQSCERWQGSGVEFGTGDEDQL